MAHTRKAIRPPTRKLVKLKIDFKRLKASAPPHKLVTLKINPRKLAYLVRKISEAKNETSVNHTSMQTTISKSTSGVDAPGIDEKEAIGISEEESLQDCTSKYHVLAFQIVSTKIEECFLQRISLIEFELSR
jgi:hypothetical protein